MAGPDVPLCGIREVDAGHLDLHRRIDTFSRLWKLGAADDALQTSLQEVREAARGHFEIEIAVLSGYGIPARHHRQIHDGILARLDTLLEEMAAGSSHQRWFAVLDEVEQIFLDHEVMEDRAFYALLTPPPQDGRLAG
ncbi:bacteriohemerythrin [mine drainage metagenome]|uniref:Bacteriohemerythrin n=1 Tax=mine drainage metagenome TaxID=410659 RepID=A0A1J5RL03_9ZZZZ